MGRQVRFFLTPTDVAWLVDQLRALGELRVLHTPAREPVPRAVDGLEPRGEGSRDLHLVQPGLVDQVVMTHIPAQQHWVVDEQRSPVIELSPGGFDGTVLREGRLYYVDGFYGPGELWQDKPESFRTWARSVLARTRKLLKRRGDWYIGPDTEQWHARGAGELRTAFDQVVP